MATRIDNWIIIFQLNFMEKFANDQLLSWKNGFYYAKIGSAKSKDPSCLDKFKCIDDDNIGPLWQHILFILFTLRIFFF